MIKNSNSGHILQFAPSKWIDCFMRSNHALGNMHENNSLTASVLQSRLSNKRKLLPTDNLVVVAQYSEVKVQSLDYPMQ